jgi:hypothetical protein
LAALAASPSAAQSPPLERVSLDDSSHEIYTCLGTGPCKNNSHPAIDALGIHVAWETDGYQVVPELPNPTNVVQVYIRDLGHGITRLISQSTAGDPGDGPSHFVVLSGDARIAAFLSLATNLDPDDKSPVQDVFVRDLDLGVTRRVSELPGGADFDGGSSAVRIALDGRSLSFTSTATNLAPYAPGHGVLPKPSGAGDVYVAHVDRRRFEWISIGHGGALPDGPSLTSTISADGRWVAFASHAANHLPGADTNGNVADVFLRDRLMGVTSPVSVALDGRLSGSGHSVRPMLADFGGHVAFQSEAAELVPGDGNDAADIFVRDLAAGTTVRVSVSAAGVEGNGDSVYPAISADGRYVVFSSTATNLAVGTEHSLALQFFAHDRDANGDQVFDEPGAIRTFLLSASPAGEPGDGNSGYAAGLSVDGRCVPFLSEAANLVPFDLNGTLIPACSPTCRSGRDIFVRRF